MSGTYQLTPSESVDVRRQTDRELEVEVTYGHGQPPLAHFHPAQDEHFTVTAGRIGARVQGVEREYGPGDEIHVPRRAVHQMWNAGEGEARAIWRTTPALRMLEWFSELDELQRSGQVGRNGMPGPLISAVLLAEYADVMRLAARPQPLVRGALKVLARVGRLRGYAPSVASSSASIANRSSVRRIESVSARRT